MRRLLSQVPVYALTAFAGMGLLLFADLFYLLIRDSNYKALVPGIALICGALLVVASIYRKAILSLHSASAARFVAPVVVCAFLPALGIRMYVDSDPAATGSLVTRTGEYRCERLSDGGSQVCLNTHSAVRYTFNRSTRNIEILSGEASFVVRKERRPFEVLSGGVLVHDSSTRFDVYKKRDSTLVTITEGRVRVVAPVDAELRHKFEVAEINTAWERAPEFYGLQQVEFHEGTGTLQVRPDLSEHKLSQLLAWQRGRIELDNSTLDEALEQFARYQPATSFRYSDRSLSRIRISGSFESIRLDEFLVVLEHEFHIHSTIARTGTETIIAFSRQR